MLIFSTRKKGKTVFVGLGIVFHKGKKRKVDFSIHARIVPSIPSRSVFAFLFAEHRRKDIAAEAHRYYNEKKKKKCNFICRAIAFAHFSLILQPLDVTLNHLVKDRYGTEYRLAETRILEEKKKKQGTRSCDECTTKPPLEGSSEYTLPEDSIEPDCQTDSAGSDRESNNNYAN